MQTTKQNPQSQSKLSVNFLQSIYLIFLLLFTITVSANNKYKQAKDRSVIPVAQFPLTTVEDYLISRGVYNLSEGAHPANDFISGTYNVNKGYVDISIKSKDNLFGVTIYTDITLIRGTGDLYFSDLLITKNTDYVNAFDAFGLQAKMMVEILKGIDAESFNNMRDAIISTFNTNIENGQVRCGLF